VQHLVDIGQDRAQGEAIVLRGTNQSGMRAQNERIVLSILRRQGPLAKTDIARLTGLSVQAVSVMMRKLEEDGLLERREKLRGKVGQPLVPMALAPNGAFFIGLKLGRRSTDLMLIDFLGRSIAVERNTYPYPTPDAVMDFVTKALPRISAVLPESLRARIGGVGIAMPFQLWNWATYVGAPQSEMDAWRHRDIQAEVAALSDWPTWVQNDATSACGAELVFGREDRPSDFLYVFIAHFIGGGLVLNGKLHTGPTGNAAAIGSMPVPGPEGTMRQLITVGSLAELERMMVARGLDAAQIWNSAENWRVPDDLRAAWIKAAAAGIAHATLCATATTELKAVMVDGWLPADWRQDLVEAIRTCTDGLDFAGLDVPHVIEGSVGHLARTLGAASIPLSQRFLVEA
jgi:predicted NBD/HSP70 family sugar kinase/predicted transcriptional regulator